MNQYHEDVAWQRLVDIQREMENSRLWADSMPSLLTTLSKLAQRAWILGARRVGRRASARSESGASFVSRRACGGPRSVRRPALRRRRAPRG
jgi:hypothetical protein